MSHGRAPVETMQLLRLEKRRREREEAAETAEGETHSHKGGYRKCRNNDWKGERAGRHDGAKESRCTVPTGNKGRKEREKSEEDWGWLQTVLQ